MENDDGELGECCYFSDEENIGNIRIDEEARSHKSIWNYEVLNHDKLFALMNDEIQQVVDILTLPNIFGRLLLNNFKWDKEKLIEQYFENENKVLKAANIPSLLTNSDQLDVNKLRDCEICYSEFVTKDMIGLECNHYFCRDCYRYYVQTKILDEGVADSIVCIAENCNYIVSDKIVMKLIIDQEVRKKYIYLITKSFVQCNRLMRWCPSPNCNHAIKVLYVENRSVKCICGYEFCFNCSEINHDPLKCGLLIKWKSESLQLAEEHETLKWINKFTKKCPNCKCNIEKNEGCDHMTCKSCQYEFCWLCLQKWSGHSSCNAFSTKNEQNNSSTNSARYLHYYQRYINHSKSLDFDKNMYAKMAKVQQKFIENGASLVEVEYLRKAIDILCECRQTLINTYVFAFYLKPNNDSIIFEENQKDLEMATQKLSRYLEHDVSTAFKFPINMKQEIQDKYKYCEQRRTVLLNYVFEGYQRKLWD